MVLIILIVASPRHSMYMSSPSHAVLLSSFESSSMKLDIVVLIYGRNNVDSSILSLKGME